MSSHGSVYVLDLSFSRLIPCGYTFNVQCFIALCFDKISSRAGIIYSRGCVFLFSYMIVMLDGFLIV